MTLCPFETLSFCDGVFRHRCPACGATRTSRTGRIVRQCPAKGRPVDSAVLIRRIAICHRCAQRPQGCWKALTYGCTLEFHKAGDGAAETASCPLGKLQ